MSRTSIVLALWVSLGTASTAFAVDPAATDLQAQLSWRATFGGSSPRMAAGYGLTVGYRAAPDAPAAQILQLDVSDRAALASLLGVPLMTRSFRLSDTDTVIPSSAEPATAESPWYSQSWVLWTAGGVAAALALAAGGGSNDSTTTPDQPKTGPSANVGPVTAGPGGVGTTCQGTDCVICPNGDIVSNCNGLAGRAMSPAQSRESELPQWLDAGTGWMGDLIAR